jgi:hypothetical protein
MRETKGSSSTGNLVRNEKQKLRATFLNNLGVAAFFGGVITPLFQTGPTTLTNILVSWAAGMILAAVCQYSGIWMLSGLEE